MTFIKKPVAVEAMRWDGKNEHEIRAWAGRGQSFEKVEITEGVDILVVSTFEGTTHASVGDWIIKGTKGEFYPCKPDVFVEVYEVFECDACKRTLPQGELCLGKKCHDCSGCSDFKRRHGIAK